jgi:hypothetical protein
MADSAAWTLVLEVARSGVSFSPSDFSWSSRSSRLLMISSGVEGSEGVDSGCGYYDE